MTGWDDDEAELWEIWWCAAIGWAEVLVESAGPGRGARERAGRDTAALLLYAAGLAHRCRPGLVQLATLARWAADPELPDRLRTALAAPAHPDARRGLAAVDLPAGAALVARIVAGLLTDRPGATPIEDVWPGTILLVRGAGPSW